VRSLGKGEAGRALNTFEWPGTNSLIFIALEEQEAARILEGLKGFRARLTELQRRVKVPMRVFTLPCEQVL
jgi:hypothetical protein